MYMSESPEVESTTPKTAVTLMDRLEEKQEVEMSRVQELDDTTKNVVIFSDSMAKYTQQYLWSHEFSYRVVAQRGAQIHDVTHNVKEFDNSTAAVIVLHVGTNNLCNKQTLDQNVQEYHELLQAVVSRFPNAGILVSGILPRFDSADLNFAAQMYNIILAQMCKAYADKVKFVDLGSHFRSERFFAIDGLHLSYQGNPRFAAKLQEAVEYHFSTDPEHVRWKEAFSAAVQKVPFPKPSLLGPVSSEKVEKTSQREVKPMPSLPRKCFKSVKRKVKESTRSRRKRLGKTTEKTCQPESNTRRGKKRKNCGLSKVDSSNPKDLDKLEELLAEFADQRASYQEEGPRPRKCKRQSSGKLFECRESQKHHVPLKDSTTPSTDCHVKPQLGTTEANEDQGNADIQDDKCSSYPVYIQMWDGRLLTADVTDLSTTKELNEAVANVYGSSLPEGASFYRGGLKVSQGTNLKHQGIVAESTVQVLLKLRGGGDRDEASGDAKAVRHMTEWTEEEAVHWMQTEAKMRPDEVKPLVEEQETGVKDIIGIEGEEAGIPLSNVGVMRSLDEAASDTSNDDVTGSNVGTAGDTTMEKATGTFVDEENLMEGLVLKADATKMAVTGNKQLLEKKSETENLQLKVQTPQELSHPQKTETVKTEKAAPNETAREATRASFIPVACNTDYFQHQ
ncbi:hypothetical protein Bbelb_033130 [Branchiostoma belcheri]|nr:hypothetical protein Bbelb_033130 [Branchiostoma belcheri]